jgi:hypothetical protein
MFIAEDPDGSGVPYNCYFPAHLGVPAVGFEGIISREDTRGQGVYPDGHAEHQPYPKFGQAFDACPKPFKYHGAALYDTPLMLGNLHHRIAALEIKTSTLWKFAEKVIAILKWRKLDKR